jgi:Fe-S-cluster-containing dehydrogenase component
MMSKRLGIAVDQERCIGCEACSVACRLENETDLIWIKVETQGGVEKDTPSGTYPNLTMNFLPKLCNHCDNPPCIEVCPVDALIKQEDGPVILNKDLCTGCKACITECPYNVISFNEKSNLAEKCNFCVHRINQGLEPFCVICCEGQALIFGDLNDSNSKISLLISSRDTFQILSEKETGSCVYYCAPKPKKVL